MAKNKRREKNRAQSRRAGAFGSPRETAAVHGGKHEGAGELELPANGPGAAASRYAGADMTQNPTTATASGKPPRGMRVEREGE